MKKEKIRKKALLWRSILLLLVFPSLLFGAGESIPVKSISIQEVLGFHRAISLDDYLLEFKEKHPDLLLQQTNVSPGLLDKECTQLYSYQQYFAGLPIVGGELRIKVKEENVFAVLGNICQIAESSINSVSFPDEMDLRKKIAEELHTLDFQIVQLTPQYELEDNQLIPVVALLVNTPEKETKQFWFEKGKLQLIRPPSCSTKSTKATTSANCTYYSGCTEHHGNTANYEHQAVLKKVNNNYELLDDCERNIKTSYFSGGNNYGVNPTNDWCSDIRYKRAYSVHWALRFTWDFFEDILGRRGQNGAGSLVEAKLGSCLPVPFGCGEYWADPRDFSINFGDNALHINQIKHLGHEYAHGVFWSSFWSPDHVPISMIDFTETRSVTEGVANIMGSEVENYTYEISANAPNNQTIPDRIDQNYEYVYKFSGENLSINNSDRCLYYKGSNWDRLGGYLGQNLYDRGFVLCHLFYLLSEGANDYQNPHHPDGANAPMFNLRKLNGSASRLDATKLMYVSLMSYIHSRWTFKEMGWAMLTTASEWWGICSPQARRVHRALWAVGLVDSETEFIINHQRANPNWPLVIRTPYNVKIQRLISGADVYIEAGRAIIDDDKVETSSGKKVVIKPFVCSGGNGFGVPGPVSILSTMDRQASPEATSSATTNKIKVSPNPFADQITIEFPLREEHGTYDIFLYNVQGKLCYRSQHEGKGGQVELMDKKITHLEAGMYYLEIRGTTSREVIKLVKRE